MAQSSNRSIDFAPAWLKLPEQTQEQKRQELHSNNPSSNIVSRSGGFTFSAISNSNVQPHHYSVINGGHQPDQHANPHLFSRNSRPISSNNTKPNSHHIQFQRSQSSGPLDNSQKSQTHASNSGNPLEEDFPSLGSGPPSTSSHNHLSSSAQWKLKLTTEQQQKGTREDPTAKKGLISDKLLNNKMPGQVYRAKVGSSKRSFMIPNSNGRSQARSQENGHHDGITLSSSVEKERRLLQQMGWKEEDSDDEGVFSEQDPKTLQEILMKGKAAREQFLWKSKQSMRNTAAVPKVLPDDDDLSTSSENSDVE